MDKKQLYESIMKNVAKEVKKTLNELSMETYGLAGMKQNMMMNSSRKDKFMYAAFNAFNKQYGVNDGSFMINGYILSGQMLFANVTFSYDNREIQTPSFADNKNEWIIFHKNAGPNNKEIVSKKEALIFLCRDMPKGYLNKVQLAVLKFEELYDKYHQYISDNKNIENDVPEWMN